MRRIFLLLFVMLTASSGGLARAQQQQPVYYPGSAQLEPFGTTTFVHQPPAPGSPALPAFPQHLTVVSRSDRTTTVSFDGLLLKVSAPHGYLVQFVSGCSGDGANPAGCQKAGCSQACAGPAGSFPPELDTVVFTTLASACCAGIRDPSPTGVVGQPVAFVSPVDPPSGVTHFLWSFGDDTTASAPDVMHTYTEPGEYEVRLTVTNASVPTRSVRGRVWIYPADTPVLHCTPGPAVPPVSACRAGFSDFTYPAGWNLVAGYQATIVLDPEGPLYTYQAGDSAYQALPFWTVLEPGTGYWAYFDGPGEVYGAGPPPLPQPVTLDLPAGQFIMIGNPFASSASIEGADDYADIVYTYEPGNGYTRARSLAPGQGAWAYSAAGGPITLTLASP